MPLFGRRSSARNGPLTAVISAGTGPHDGEWEVIWIGQGGKVPRRFVTTSLSTAAEQATTAARRLALAWRGHAGIWLAAHLAHSLLIADSRLPNSSTSRP
jgi:hypothetical protein